MSTAGGSGGKDIQRLWLVHLGLSELSPQARDLADRLAAFLYMVIKDPHVHTRALLAGYTPDVHGLGVYMATVLAGQRSFLEWREWRALRPPRDADLPIELAELDGFFELWAPRVLQAATTVDGDEWVRLRTLALLEDSKRLPSRTWRAARFAGSLKAIRSDDSAGLRKLWAELAAQGIEAHLERFERTLEGVRNCMRDAPLDEAELGEIDQERERCARQVGHWLDDRRQQLQPHLGPESLEALGLGDRVPAPPREALLPEAPLRQALAWSRALH